ncbi:MAG: helix-turn-helix domain-containing protein [Desulfovibrionales bacterium]
MARPLRIEFPGAWYHVMNRGRRGERTFVNKQDFLSFVELLKRSVETFRVRVSAYCLMSNHYHLLIQTPEANLSRAMRHLNAVYTQDFNRRHGTDGALFRGRFKSILIEEESYLLGLVRYIHHNPLKAGIVEDLKEYPWSSHHGYLSSARKWSWLYKEPVLSQFGDEPGKAVKAYRQYMAQEDEEEITRIFSLKKLPSILGTPEFVGKIRERFFQGKSYREIPQARHLAPDENRIKETVCRLYGCDSGELYQSRRGRENEARNMAIYLCRRLRGDTLDQIARSFAMRTYSAVSSVVVKMEKRMNSDPALRKRMQKIRNEILNSQNEI